VGRVGRGDILVVARIDRLARSLVHLLEVIERVEAVGGHFKSLRDPIDTSTPQGRFALQVLGAAAELERALIRERTRAGLRAAKARGRVGGNPGLRRRDPEAIRKLSALRDRQYMAELLSTLDAWMPRVRAMRPAHSWGKVAWALGRLGSPDRPWTRATETMGQLRLLQPRTRTLYGTFQDLFTPLYPAKPANNVQPAPFVAAARAAPRFLVLSL